LVETGGTASAQLGAMGGSAGGLLIGVMLPKSPELFGALVCQNPVLDMRRYHLYPPVLITSSTNDGVHPGHARKMTAALEAAGHRVTYYENTEGGHSRASNNAQATFERALRYEFLLQTLC
jgi:prolyl oligopeptidase